MANPEAERLLRVGRRDLKMARRLLDPEVEEARWGWAVQQCVEKTLKAWLHIVGTKPPQTHDLARLLLLLQDSVLTSQSCCRCGPSPPSRCNAVTKTNPNTLDWTAPLGASARKP
jgi:HEPN domain-containing protein